MPHENVRKQRLLTAFLTMAGCGWSLQAAAQADANKDPRLQPNTSLEEIIVTAQKRSERLQDVPVSISVLDSSALVSQLSVSLQDYFAQVPGLTINPGNGGRVTVVMRGISTGTLTNPTVGITVDDVPVGSTTGITYGTVLASDIDPALIERVEVLRGPQGTLYGAASVGGLLRYVTVRPRMNEFGGSFQADGSTVDDGGDGYGVRASANIPLVDDKLAAAASGFFRHDAGLVDDPGLGTSDVDSADVFGGRISALWQATDDVSLRLAALYQDIDGDGSPFIDANQSLQPIDGLTHNNIAGTGSYERKLQLVDATLSIDFGWAELTSITAYNASEFLLIDDHTARLGFLTQAVTGQGDLGTMTFLPSETDKFSQEIRLVSPSGQKLEWLLGAFYTDEDSDVAFDVYASDPQTGAIITPVFLDSFPSTFEERAIFGAATFHFTDRFDVQIGGRWSENEQNYDEVIGGPLFDPPATVHAESEDDSFTYLLAPRFRISPDVMVYARVATGYRPGGPNPGAGFGFPSQFDADTSVNYEMGIKSELLERRVMLDVSAYYIDWDDLQLQQLDPDTQFAYFTNAGKARSRGVELTVQAAPGDGLTLMGTVGYSDPELTEPVSGTSFAQAGDPLPFGADWNASLSLDKEFPLSDSVSGFVGGTLTYLGERYGGFPPRQTTPRVVLPSFTTVDLRAGVEISEWTISVFGRNIADERGALSAAPEVSSGATGIYLLDIVRPRTYGISVAKEF